jgi:hypothetical protein
MADGRPGQRGAVWAWSNMARERVRDGETDLGKGGGGRGPSWADRWAGPHGWSGWGSCATEDFGSRVVKNLEMIFPIFFLILFKQILFEFKRFLPRFEN